MSLIGYARVSTDGFCQSSRQQVLRDADDAAGPIRQLAIGSLRLQCGG